MKSTFNRREILVLLDLMEEGKIHYCGFCDSFIADSVWPIHLEQERKKTEE